ncbi:relaxase/mobilization nuclease domain-containing protein [Porphyromonas gulae]|uniref:Mobilization protein n=1 Tax=Porphyromonas gulae TaxID=111105 RepID=A0A0A2F5J3_9PORP|nr:relaxase/mobilization nuclease domain-containing protein [Porphyromonas gulae]KGN85312.1 mobilization protein [Porphyromonas gulae]
MIAKIIKGSSFAGVLAYILGKGEEKARVLHAEGVREHAIPTEIASDFALQASLRPRVQKPVCHTILSFSAEDMQYLSDEHMVDLAKEYLQQMGYTNTQYIIVRHLDREHPHLHICINRVDNEGRAISDSNEKYRSVKICREMTLKHELKWGEGKNAVKRQRLRGHDKLRYSIFDAIKYAIPQCQNWHELMAELQKQGIETQFKTKGQTSQVEGVIFVKDGVSFSGSHIDRSCNYSKLSAQLEQNQLALLKSETKEQETELCEELSEVFDGFTESLLSTGPSVDVAELVFQRKLRNQANNKPKRRKL